MEEHLGVVETAELRALGPVDTDVLHGEIEGVQDPGLGVAAEVELGHVEAVDRILGAQVDADGLTGGDHQAGAVAVVGGGTAHSVQTDRVGIAQGLALDAHVFVGVVELPAPLEGIHVDDLSRMGGHVVHVVLCPDGESEQDEHDDDGDDEKRFDRRQ